MQQLWHQYRSQKTNTAISYVTHDRLDLPFITICPKVPRKEPTILYTEEDHKMNTLSYEDIFSEVTFLSYFLSAIIY